MRFRHWENSKIQLRSISWWERSTTTMWRYAGMQQPRLENWRTRNRWMD